MQKIKEEEKIETKNIGQKLSYLKKKLSILPILHAYSYLVRQVRICLTPNPPPSLKTHYCPYFCESERQINDQTLDLEQVKCCANRNSG